MYTIRIDTDGTIVLTPCCIAGAEASAATANTVKLYSIMGRAALAGDADAPATSVPARDSTTRIELQPGEHYAGVVLDAQGQAQHHLVLLPAVPANDLNWKDALAWAESVGGSLPTRQEQSLLFGNCKSQFTGSAYWSSEQYSASGAWFQYFSLGGQSHDYKSAELRARAVRRFAD